MLVHNTERNTTLGEAIEVADTAVQRVKGLMGRDCLMAGEGLLFKRCSSLHTFFMRFPIDVLFLDKNRKVLKPVPEVSPFKLVVAPLRAFYALELPAGVIATSSTRKGDHLDFSEVA